jgi:GcrA cell cycle regulator
VTWTDERVDALKQAWTDGLTASQIAVRLGDGVTRNMVLGKAIRLGLPRRGKAAPRTARVSRATPRPKPRAAKGNAPVRLQPRPRDDLGKLPATPLPSPAESDVPRVATLDLEPEHCRWAVGDPLEVGPRAPLFCGLPKLPGISWCEAHARRAFDGPRVRPRVEVEPAREPELAA